MSQLVSAPTTTQITPAATSDSAAVAQGALLSATLPSIEIAPLKTNEVKALAPEGSMLEMFERMGEQGAPFIAQAKELAERTTLKDLKPLLDFGQKARDEITAISKQVIGDAKVSDLGAASDLISSLYKAGQKVNPEAVSAKPNIIMTELLKHQWFNERFAPIVRFIERCQKVTPLIESKEALIVSNQADSTKRKCQFEAMKDVQVQNFRITEVAIAAGEIVLKREVAAFEDRRTKVDKTNIVSLAELQTSRNLLMNLDTRIISLMGSRGDAIVKFGLLDSGIQNETSLIATFENLRSQVIPSIFDNIAITINAERGRLGAVLATGAMELKADLTSAAIRTMGVAQQATAQAAMGAAKSALKVVENFKEYITLVKQAKDLIDQQATLHKNVKTQFAEGELELKTAFEEALRDQATTPAQMAA